MRDAAQLSPEMADVIAYLEQRAEAADKVARKAPDFAQEAAERRRQLEVIIDDFRNGLHMGSADARAMLKAHAAEKGSE